MGLERGSLFERGPNGLRPALSLERVGQLGVPAEPGSRGSAPRAPRPPGDLGAFLFEIAHSALVRCFAAEPSCRPNAPSEHLARPTSPVGAFGPGPTALKAPWGLPLEEGRFSSGAGASEASLRTALWAEWPPATRLRPPTGDGLRGLCPLRLPRPQRSWGVS